MTTPIRGLRLLLHRLFEFGIVIKGIDGLLEVAGGGVLLLVGHSTLTHLAQILTAHELSEDPRDLIANGLRHLVRHLSHDTRVFAAAYLLAHGAIKLWLVINMLRRRVWAYPVAVAFLLLFIAYQLYRFGHTHSPELLALSMFDAIVALLIWREYRLLVTG